MDVFEGGGKGVNWEGGTKVPLERGNNWVIRVFENTEELVNSGKSRGNILESGNARQCKYMIVSCFTENFFQKQINFVKG